MKELDRTRPRTSASNKHKKDICLDIPEIVSFNLYPEWYSDQNETAVDCIQDMMQWIRNNPVTRNKPFIVSEIGAGALYGKGKHIMINLSAAIEAVTAQQPKEENAVWMVGEQLKDMLRQEPHMAEIVLRDLEVPEMQAIAKAHGVHPALIALKWAHQRGEISIPFSVHNYASNLKCVTEDPLTEEEMATIATLEKGNRLVKGQVFLWHGANDWHDLWDEDGVIVK